MTFLLFFGWLKDAILSVLSNWKTMLLIVALIVGYLTWSGYQELVVSNQNLETSLKTSETRNGSLQETLKNKEQFIVQLQEKAKIDAESIKRLEKIKAESDKRSGQIKKDIDAVKSPDMTIDPFMIEALTGIRRGDSK